ncbi:MAG TPA: hypothetical protein VK446_15540 [Methylocystis sp.]|nr:hypothetical protein [Methylocystis sp.]
MSFILAVVYVITCGGLIWLLLTRRDVIFAQYGVLGLFSLGYYPLPVLFKPLSSLAGTEDEKVFSALLIHWVFLIAILAGSFATARLVGAVRPLSLGRLDEFCYKYRFFFSAVAFGLYVAYVLTTPQTSYASEDFDAFFEQKSPVRSILAAVSELCISFICVSFAVDSAKKNHKSLVIFGGMVVAIVLATLPLGQRTATLTPIMFLFASMAAQRQSGKALQVLGVGLIVLMAVSPFAVYLREARRAKNGDFLNTSEVAGKFTVESNPLMQSFQSIIDRSDLVYNTVYMKDYIDETEYVGWKYYYSVAVSPIPRFVYPNKPYVLSSNGNIDGELSVLAWKEMNGGLGSLTAFGGITAYREGGWAGVLLDGLADGALFVLIARWLGGGGYLAKVFYSIFFVMFAVAKAPPCFFEALATFLGQAPLIVSLIFISKLPLYGVRRMTPSSRSPLRAPKLAPREFN